MSLAISTSETWPAEWPALEKIPNRAATHLWQSEMCFSLLCGGCTLSASQCRDACGFPLRCARHSVASRWRAPPPSGTSVAWLKALLSSFVCVFYKCVDGQTLFLSLWFSGYIVVRPEEEEEEEKNEYQQKSYTCRINVFNITEHGVCGWVCAWVCMHACINAWVFVHGQTQRLKPSV